MAIKLNVNKEKCTVCAKCTKVCPSKIFVLNVASKAIDLVNLDMCIRCGHCSAACPEGAVEHSSFPPEKVHPVDYSQMPTPEQMMLLVKTRRSNRAFSTKPIPEESMEMILEAAHRAPTGSNMQEVKFVVVRDPEMLKQIIDFTMESFNSLAKKFKHPIYKRIIKLTMPQLLRYGPLFERMYENYKNGEDGILRKATSVIFIYTPKGVGMGAADANLAYQNGSLMAECLGVSQFYTGFVLNAANMNKGKLEQLLGIKGQIHAGMALGMPQFRYSNYIDRRKNEVKMI